MMIVTEWTRMPATQFSFAAGAVKCRRRFCLLSIVPQDGSEFQPKNSLSIAFTAASPTAIVILANQIECHPFELRCDLQSPRLQCCNEI